MITDLQPSEQVEIEDGVFLDIQRSDLRDKFGEIYYSVPLPVDKSHFTALLNYYRKQKDWFKYFMLKNTYPDLRPKDASTVHKAQGSTFDTAFIDLTDLSTCRDKNQAARLLYVAFSRARNRVVLYGDLAEKFGGLIY